MKNMLFLVLLVLSPVVSATNYYISSAGSDISNGLSETTPWRTIAKVNSSFSSFRAGDRILFRRGDTFYGTLRISVSGGSGNPIVISSYGTGNNPVITGFTTLSVWTNESGGVYSAQVTSEALTNMVTIDGVQYGMGRYPHNTYLTFESHSTNVSITDNSLTGYPDWTGAEVVINKNGWTLDRCLITSHTSNTLRYTSLGSSEEPNNGRNYFIQNDRRCLTNYGDWYHNPATNRLFVYFGTVSPETRVVQMATLNYLIHNPFYTNITVDGVSFKGSVSNAMQFQSTCDYNRIVNCSVSFAGNYGIYYHGNYGSIDNNQVSNCVLAGINEDYGSHVTITNNTVQNIGLIKGSATRATYSVGIKFEDTYGAVVQYNTVRNTAYNGISVTNHSAPHIVKNNLISYCCPWSELDDGGGIYTYNFTGTVVRTIENNVILHVGDNTHQNNSSGIYLDETSKSVIVRNNTVAHCGIGIHIHKGNTNTIEGNNVYDNFNQIQFSNWTYTPLIYSNIIRNNIFMAKANIQSTMAFYTTYNEIAAFGAATNNVYARPVSENTTFFIYPSTRETLEQWKTRVSPQDANSLKSNVTTADTTGFFRFIYNASQAVKVVPLNVPMMDSRGIKHSGSITVQPYSSAILLKDPAPSAVTIPAYVSSVIENLTPSIINVTYSASLSATAASATAFIVTVNGIRRNVNTVVISGTRVNLTLASPAIFGDIVTIAYTKPSLNPLQTTAGGQAASITAQPVLNKISPPVPLYQSSVIQDQAADKLEITYNMNLANVLPPLSAFTVRINSIVRTPSSISILGNKVTLTLPIKVLYRDIVTVAYTKPAVNPLQTPSNGQAETILPRDVTNNVSSIILTTEPETLTGIKIYPNPARELINISNREPSSRAMIIRIFDLSGKLCLETLMAPYSENIQIPLNLQTGVYFIHISFGTITKYTKKLIIR